MKLFIVETHPLDGRSIQLYFGTDNQGISVKSLKDPFILYAELHNGTLEGAISFVGGVDDPEYSRALYLYCNVRNSTVVPESEVPINLLKHREVKKLGRIKGWSMAEVSSDFFIHLPKFDAPRPPPRKRPVSKKQEMSPRLLGATIALAVFVLYIWLSQHT